MQRVVVLMVVLVMATPLDVLAQSAATPEAQAAAPEKPNTFTTEEACKAALKSGNFRYYEPKFYGLKSREPVDNINRIVVPLESDMCVHMQVVGGRRFVVQKEGELFRGRRYADGSVSLYARNDCGNRVYDVVFPAPAVPVEMESEPEPAPVVPMGPPPLREREPYRVYDEPKGSKKKWWIAGGAALLAGIAAARYWPCPDGTKRR